MSRTIRRKNPSWHRDLKWIFKDWDENHCPVRVDPNAEQHRKALRKFHSDAGTWQWEPGPSWFRNLNTERPQRREAKQQLHRYVQGEDFEVILEAKMPLEYWT